MSTDSQPGASQPETPQPARSRKLLLIVVILLGVVIGGGGGAFVAAPLLAGKVVTPPDSAAGKPDGDTNADDHEGGEHGKTGAAPVVHMVDNLVLNPANSGGSRFLLLSVGLAVKDEATATMLKERDPELRDVVLRLVGSRTIDELADIARRDSLKAELRAAVSGRFGADAARAVYFPQFVIQ